MTRPIHIAKVFAIDAYVEGLLSEAGRTRFEHHLNHCAVCTGALRAAREYRVSVEHLRALPLPELNWDRISASALPATSDPELSALPRRRPVRALIYPMLALAAAAVLALLPRSPTQPDVHKAKAPTALTDGPRNQPVAPPQTATIMAVMGRAERLESVGGDAATAAVPMDTLREGDTLRTSAASVVDLRLSDGSLLRLQEESALLIGTLRQGQVELTLERGRLEQHVSPVPPSGRYLVHCGDMAARVVGTVFSISHDDTNSQVDVSEGRVEVVRAGQQVLVLAGQRWQARTGGIAEDVSETGRGHITMPGTQTSTALVPSGAGQAPPTFVTAHLPAFPRAVELAVDGSSFPHAGELAMRLPTREVEIAVRMNDGRIVRARWTPSEAEPTLSLVQMRRLLFGAPAPAPGNLSAAQLQSAVNPGRRHWQRCYERALRQDTALRPSLLLRIELRADGKVRRTLVTGDVAGNKVLSECVDGVARGLSFPPPEGPFTFEVPLAFRARTP